jgi:hypothetical protein
MKAYQVYSGDVDSNENQKYELVATYFDKDAALAHARQIANQDASHNNEVTEVQYNSTRTYWYQHGWIYVDVAKIEEITII